MWRMVPTLMSSSSSRRRFRVLNVFYEMEKIGLWKYGLKKQRAVHVYMQVGYAAKAAVAEHNNKPKRLAVHKAHFNAKPWCKIAHFSTESLRESEREGKRKPASQPARASQPASQPERARERERGETSA